MLPTFISQGLPTIFIGNVFVKQWGISMSYGLCESVRTNYLKTMIRLGVLNVILDLKNRNAKDTNIRGR